MSDATSLAGKIVLVTGASSGIGRAIALDLAADGIRLAICARRVDRLDALAEQARARRAANDVLALPCDLRDEADIGRMFARIREQWGGVDILVNNAGLGRHASLLEGSADDWREMLDVNVLALCICTREAVQDMRRRGDQGYVFHISSMAAHRVPRFSGMYSASKFAVRSLTEGLRQELRELESAIRVTAISPGFVETEFAEHFHKSAEAAKKTYGRFKVLEPNDVAEMVLYALATPDHVQVHDLLVRPTCQPD